MEKSVIQAETGRDQKRNRQKQDRPEKRTGRNRTGLKKRTGRNRTGLKKRTGGNENSIHSFPPALRFLQEDFILSPSAIVLLQHLNMGEHDRVIKIFGAYRTDLHASLALDTDTCHRAEIL